MPQWSDYFDVEQYKVLGFGTDWWDVTGQAADRLGIPHKERRANAPAPFRILKRDKPQIYVDKSPEALWITFDVDALSAEPYRRHKLRSAGSRYVLLWREKAQATHDPTAEMDAGAAGATGRSRALRIDIQIDIAPGGREVRRDRISAATEEGVRILCELLADQARVAGTVTWQREFYYTASRYGQDGGTFKTSHE